MDSAAARNVIQLSRLFPASPKEVWAAWVELEQVAKWWGPRGFTLTTESKDVRPGGEWIYTMHGPDGHDFPNHTRFLEVEEFRRMVYDHGGTKKSPPMFRVNVSFHEVTGGTEMNMIMTLPNAEAAERIRRHIKEARGDSTWDRLTEFLIAKKTAREVFVISRSFSIELDQMFTLWTDPKHVMNWMAPTGFSGKYLQANIVVGGESFYSMSNDTVTMYGKARYLEIENPRRLVYTQVFCDQSGNITRHPAAPTWPATMKTTVQFVSESQSQTRVSLEWEVVGPATAVEKGTFLQGRAGMTEGWMGSFDKLEAYIRELK